MHLRRILAQSQKVYEKLLLNFLTPHKAKSDQTDDDGSKGNRFGVPEVGPGRLRVAFRWSPRTGRQLGMPGLPPRKAIRAD
jgi:hypothetical protein